MTVTATTRHPAVAGSFYPNDSQRLQQQVSQFLAQAPRSDIRPKALIVPHAGYIYSGPIAATAYNILNNCSSNIEKVVLLGPSHRVPLRGIASPGCDYFQTPLGDIPLDTETLVSLEASGRIKQSPQAHQWEHSLEVQLPFLQTMLNDFQLIPLVVGEASAENVAAVIDDLWGSDETLIVISSDLSHYLTYRVAQQTDFATSNAIEACKHNLHGNQACGCHAINGLLASNHAHTMNISTLDLRNSGDTAGDKDKVVGYGAYALH